MALELSRVLRVIRVIFFIMGFLISILTFAMSYDAARMGLGNVQTAQTVQIFEDDEITTASFEIRIQNEGYIFALNDANLKITAFDIRYPERPLGTGSTIFTVDPGEEFSGDIRIPMSTTEYQSAARINVTVTLDGGLALKLPFSRITFVTFTLSSSEVTAK